MKRMAVLAMLTWLALGCSERRPAPTTTTDPEQDKERAETAERKEVKVLSKKLKKKISGAFPAQVAGGFYTANPRELAAEVEGFLDAAGTGELEAGRDIVAVLSPHAGYRYSGPVAGKAYRTLVGRGFETVIVMALSHRGVAAKAALIDRPAYDTPLGSLEIDTELTKRLLADHPEAFEVNERVFQGEHSLEVQLPFIQKALPDAKIVPMIVAVRDEATIASIGAALFEAVGRRGDVVFALSSDLSHFFPYDKAVALDDATLKTLEEWRIDDWKAAAARQSEGMCGYKPTLAFIEMFSRFDPAKRKVSRIAYQNSGDTAGDKSRVVGYGALAFTLERGMRNEKKPAKDFGPFGPAERRYLMELAKRAVTAAVKGEDLAEEEPASKLLADKGAAFVTLKKNGKLRGCIGHVLARVPLHKCVTDVAKSAAIYDRRFKPVSPEELADLDFEISVLTAPEPTAPDDVVVGRDGLIMSRGGRSGLLLPQVPVEWNWDREEFLAHTCRKAGLPLGCWKDSETKIESFRAIVWGEEDLED